MPVLKIFLDRFLPMVGTDRGTVIERLPYLGLDIEGVEEDSIRVEYSPNRPDFSTDYGIARALRGLLGIETGLPKYRVDRGKVAVWVSKNLAKIRPFIACAVAYGLNLDDEAIRQLISMQEDLHNGLGRKRKKVSIGLHNLDVIAPPVYYEGRDSSFSFTPLGASEPMTIRDILLKTETGRSYGHILNGAKLYPILRDSKGMVLSFPPIINGTETKIDTRTRNIFVDVTSTEEQAGLNVLAILVSALSDAGGRLEDVSLHYATKVKRTPDLSPGRVRLDRALVQRVVGLEMSTSSLRSYLRRSRLDLASNKVYIPPYRIDILHPVDIGEEVAIGYGLDRLQPLYPASYGPGNFHPFNESLERFSAVVTQSGFIETMNYELTDEASLYSKFDRSSDSKIAVENPRSLEHHLLRDSLIPSLMAVLARNIKEEYPQRIFEIGRAYVKSASLATEQSHLAALIASTSTSFSEASMHLSATFRTVFGVEVATKTGTHWSFAAGRCAEVVFRDAFLGYVGQVKPSAIASFGLEVPVAGFEVNLSGIPAAQNR